MFESAPSDNPENNQASKKPKWENIDIGRLPNTDKVLELMGKPLNERKEANKTLIDLFSRALGQPVAHVNFDPQLSGNVIVDVYLEDRGPSQSTKDFQLHLDKTDEGYEWSSALKYNGSK